MGYRLITPPAAFPVTLAEAKAQCRVDHADDDAILNRLIAAATSYLDARAGVLNRCLINQTWELTLDAFPPDEIQIDLGPVQSIVDVNYDDPSGAAQSLVVTSYILDAASPTAWVVSQDDWPATIEAVNAVRVRFIAGYGGTSAAVPDAIRHAILMLVSHWYENREAVGQPQAELPMAVTALLAPYRAIFV
ncbi:MAG: head-tail connector protein [Acidobacteriota bacterium]|jgi:uncharacterized phiE125 gp8 family phage protein